MDLGTMMVTFAADIEQLTSGVAEAKSQISSVGDSAQDSGQKTSGGFMGAVGSIVDFGAKIGQTVMGIQGLASGAIGLAQGLLQPAESAEQMQTAFTTLLGSTSAANDELQKLDAFASKTPFQTMDIDQAASQLIGFGVSAQDTIPDLTAIGDALSAVGKGSTANLDSIVDIFGKMKTQGVLTGGAMQQMSRDGINAWAVLEQQTGKTKDQLTTMISSGLIPADTAMHLLTKGIEENPLYAGGMAKQSNTMVGIISTLKSNWDQMLASFGSPIIQTLEGGLSDLGTSLSSPTFKTFASEVGQGIGTALKTFGDDLQQTGNFLKNTFMDPLSHLKEVIDPLVKSFGDWNTKAQPMNGTLSGIKNTVSGMVGGLATLVNDIASLIGWFEKGGTPAQVVGDALSAIGIAITAIKIAQFLATLPALFFNLGIWASLQWATAAATLATAAPYLLVAGIIAAVVFGIILAIQHWGAISKWLSDTWSAVCSAVGAFFSGLGTHLHDIVNGIVDFFKKWGLDILEIMLGPVGLIIHFWQPITKFFQDIVGDIGNAFSGLGKLISNIWDGILGAIKWAINGAIDLINGFIGGIDNIGVDVGPIHIHPDIPTIPHFASGVQNFGGGLALVGEQGPELVSLPGGSSVYPNSVLSGGSSSSASSQPSQGAYDGTQTIIIELDGQVLTQAIGNRQAKMIRLQTARRVA